MQEVYPLNSPGILSQQLLSPLSPSAAFTLPASPPELRRTMASSTTKPECKGCYHPRPAESIATQGVTNVGLMKENSRAGCASCAILLQGIQACMPSLGLQSDELLRLDFNVRGTKSLELRLLPSLKTVSFFTPEGECLPNHKLSSHPGYTPQTHTKRRTIAEDFPVVARLSKGI